MNRYARTQQLLGDEALSLIQNARIAIFGLGAVGSYATEALARAGVGYLRLIDFDTINPTNINRQLFALESTVETQKTDIAVKRVLDINPDCHIDARTVFIDPNTVWELIQPEVDVIVDAIDCINSKVYLMKTAIENKQVIISSMGAGGRTRAELIRIGDISETRNCPLAKVIRKQLRKFNIHKGIRCVYSLERPRNKQSWNEADADQLPEDVLPRRPIGTISYLPGIFGLEMAQLALEEILKGLLHGDMQHFI